MSPKKRKSEIAYDSNLKNYKCGTCLINFSYLKNANKHVKLKRCKLPKKNCNKEFAKKSNKDRHVTSTHYLETTTLPDELNDDNENDHVPTMVDEHNLCGSGNVDISSESNEGEKDSSSSEEDTSGAEDFSVESLPLQSTFVEDKIDRDSIEESVVEPVEIALRSRLLNL